METREAAALASEPDKTETVTTGDAEHRERREIRGRTGLGEFLAAAVGGGAVAGAALEYAAGVQRAPEVGHIPMALFQGPSAGCGRGTRHHDRAGG